MAGAAGAGVAAAAAAGEESARVVEPLVLQAVSASTAAAKAALKLIVCVGIP